MEVQAELDRVATFRGGNINSSVVHGSQQRFPIKARAFNCCILVHWSLRTQRDRRCTVSYFVPEIYIMLEVKRQCKSHCQLPIVSWLQRRRQ